MRVGIWLFSLGLWSNALAEDFKIATFNTEFLTRPKVHIKFGFAFRLENADQVTWNAAGFRDQKFGEAASAVASVIARIDADVIALTEVGNPTDVAELNTRIGALGVTYPHIANCDCTDHTTQQHVAVLSKIPFVEVLTRIPGREHYYEELDDADTEQDTGLSKAMRVSFQTQGQTINLYVAHLASERGGHEQDQQRIAQASIVRRHYLPGLSGGEHIIVAGDLNDDRGQPTLQRIRGLEDIWGDLIQTGNARYFSNQSLGDRWTYEFMGVRNQIDHILISRSLILASSDIFAEVPDQPDPFASDHRPFVLTIDLE